MRSRISLLIGVAAASYAWWVTALPPFSASATMAVLGGGVLALGVGRRRRPTSTAAAAATTRGVVLWVVLTSALAAWQVAAFVQSPRAEHPTLSSLANTALDPRPVRALAVIAWLAGAAWLAR